MAKPDLNKLKAEIDTRKKERGIVSSNDSMGNAPRDKFLNGLLESLQTGKETESTSLVKTVDNKVAIKKGETSRLPVNEVIAPVQNNQIPRQSMNMSPERDEQLFIDLERKRKQTLAESMQNYIGPNVNYGQPTLPINGQPTQLNEVYLTENVRKIVDNYLIENFGPIVEEAIKSTILEMYAVERIKEVLTENKEMVQKIVYDTIREIQAKSKAKAQH